MVFHLNFTAKLNFLIFGFSIAIIISGIWLRFQVCNLQFLEIPIIIFGVLLLVLSVVCVIADYYYHSVWFTWVYFVLMFLLIFLIWGFSIYFGFIIGGGQSKTGRRGYEEYGLQRYSGWFQKRVGSEKIWNGIKRCLDDQKICQYLAEEADLSLEEFNAKHLSAVESGCCNPPQDCGFTYKSATIWDKNTTNTLKNPDCTTWANAPALCFDCNSCKGAVLENTKRAWKKVSVWIIIFTVFVLVVLLLSFICFCFFFF